ncbi:hypothetical protein QJR26_02660 [Clostridium baratii]
MSKKVILFIVEGITDKESLALILSRLIKNNRVEFYVVGGDITSNKNTTLQNCITKVNDCVKMFLKDKKFYKRDILRVVHLIDTDGAFIEDKFIKQSNEDNVKYTKENIMAKNVESIIARNERKSSVLNKLYSTESISNINYSMYYFSCNLEHVLHDEQNLDDSLKCEYAEQFIDRYDNREFEFIEFLNNSDFTVNKDYKESWNFIKKELNSLNRYCNLHILLNELLDNE